MVDCNHKVSLIKLRELDFFASGNLGVDYETMNPTAKIFWKKNSIRTPYQWSEGLIPRKIKDCPKYMVSVVGPV